MIFLFDPFINIFDILPDVIGYALIVYGLSKMADLELKVAEARRRMTSALAVAAGKVAVVLLSFIMEFDSTLVLVFAFSFATLEIFFVIPAFNMLFESLEYSCMRFSEKLITRKVEDLQKVTPIFIIVRAVAAVVPQLTALTNEYGYVGEETGLENSGVIYVMLTVICAVVSFVFGIVWLSAVVPYFKALKKNGELCEYLRERYAAEVLTDDVLHMKRSIKRFTALLFASLFMFICIPIDGYYMMPEFLAAVFMLFAFYFAKRYTSDYKKTLALCALAAAVSFAAYLLLYRYSSEMGYIFLPYKAKGFWGYFTPYAAFAAVYYVLFFFMFGRARTALRTMVESCMGLRGTQDARRRETDEYRKKELCGK
ncbi:MAG: hypothetical protein IJW21_02385, partial [Clostridia bacterium]|nr:hypothetical protein [Clostridia bacterium]